MAPDWLADDERVAHHRFEPARPGQGVDWPTWLPSDVIEHLVGAGIQAPWAHQVEAADHAFAGRHVAIGTGTASGKSLAYLMPILAATASATPGVGVEVDSLRSKLAPRRPHTALYLSPTKALAHDQLRAARRLAPEAWNAIALDGDANQAERRFARDWADLVLTNPDMLHLSVLPNHRRWGALLGNLRYVVIDEAHRYRGVFGTHVAQVVRRLRRICQFHGADPTFVLASATSSDPGRTGQALIGDPVQTVTIDQAPHPARSVVLLRPERDTNTEAADLLAHLVAQGRQTLAFVGSRVQSELVAQHAQERLGEAPAKVASYRSGYLAEDRRSIESQLQSGALAGVAATSALELGIDVSGMDAVVIAGFPGTRAAFWQRAGRAGRGDRDALVVAVARDDPLDQYLWAHPELLLGPDPDAVVLNPQNRYVLGPHVLAAAQELPLTLDDERWFGDQVGPIARAGEARGWLRTRPHRGGQAWFWARSDRAVDGISLRAMGSGPIRVIEPESGQVIGEVDQASADRMVHTGAVYLHMGEQWLVEDYRPDEQQALARRVHLPYFTQAQSTSEVAILTDVDDAPFGAGPVRVHHGRVRIREQVLGYLRRDTESLQVWDSTPLDLPPRDLVTHSMWWTIPDEVLEAADLEGPAVGAAAHGLEHTAIGLLPAFTTCDRWDIGGLSTAMHAQTGQCTIFVHDGHPGGAGFAEAGHDRSSAWLQATVERLERCACQTGCPSCVVSPKCGNANQMLDKAGALRLGRAMLGLTSVAAGPGPRQQPPDQSLREAIVTTTSPHQSQRAHRGPHEGPDAEAAVPPLLPLPTHVQLDEGQECTLVPQSVLVASGDAAPVAELLATQLRPATGYALPVVSQRPKAGTAAAAVTLRLDPAWEPPASPSPDEGYLLVVDGTGITITATAPHGLWNGAQTLRQLFGPMMAAPSVVRADWSVPALTIADAPRFAHRGVQVDVARSFLAPEELERIIDALAALKINRLHLHLSDDQGWRLEITNDGRAPDDPVDYTRLAEVGGATAMEAVNDPERPCTNELGRTGHYSQATYRDLVRHAAARFVTIIPEIDTPGHTVAMLHAIPELNSAASQRSEGSKPPATRHGTAAEQTDGTVGASTLDVANPQTWVSLRHILGQVAALTEGAWLHIGGDESHVTPREEYVEFVTGMVELVHELGKCPIGWNEYAVGGLRPGDVVQYWTGDTEVTRQAVERGATVVVSKSDAAYLDQKYTDQTPIGLDWAGGGDVEVYYDWDPAELVAGLDEHSVLGVEAPMWSETLRGREQNEFLMFPRAAAMAEIGWTAQPRRALDDFLRRLGSLGAGWLVQGTNFYDTPLVPWVSAVAGRDRRVATADDHGADAEADPVVVALVAAPGTRPSADGAQIIADRGAGGVAGTGNESAPLSAIVETGSGQVAGRFSPVRPRSDLAAGSLYRVEAPLSDGAGDRGPVTVRFSDGRTVESRVHDPAASGDGAAADGPSGTDTWPGLDVEVGSRHNDRTDDSAGADPSASARSDQPDRGGPSLVLGAGQVRDDARVVAQLQGFAPLDHVAISFDQAHQGFLRADDRGNASASLHVVHQTPPGPHEWTATGSDGRVARARVVVGEPPQ